jgi:hypothetical protein
MQHRCDILQYFTIFYNILQYFTIFYNILTLSILIISPYPKKCAGPSAHFGVD